MHTIARLISRISIFTIVFTIGCSASRTPPNLAAIYNMSAQAYEHDRSPVIVIPGILGSRLKDRETGQQVWGSFLGGFANPNTPMGARQIALPLSNGRELNELPTNTVADGVLGKVTVSLLGLPVQLNAYFHILQALGIGGYRDRELSEAGAIDYGDEHFTCFQFPYDWRRDISHTAEELHKFILKEKAYVEAEFKDRYGIERDVKFTIVAHSMGGLLTRYYLRHGATPLRDNGELPEITWEGAKHIDQVVLIGTPNSGSVFALNDLVNGKSLGPITPTYPEALLGTMPAIYQLLPRARHGFYKYDDGEIIENILDPALWEKHQWGLADPDQDEVLEDLLPTVENKEERRKIALAHQAASLKRAAMFQKAIDRPAKLPNNLKLSLFAGDAKETPSSVIINRQTNKITLATHKPGDGIVTRASALGDERPGREWQPRLLTPIDWSNITFLSSDHLGLTKDPSFIDNVLFTILEEPL